MKIPLKDKILNIKLLQIWKAPNINKLEKELSKFFKKNKIEGIKIKEFEIQKNVSGFDIVSKEPPIEERLCGGKYEKQLETIGEKYGIKNLGLIYWCYGK